MTKKKPDLVTNLQNGHTGALLTVWAYFACAGRGCDSRVRVLGTSDLKQDKNYE